VAQKFENRVNAETTLSLERAEIIEDVGLPLSSDHRIALRWKVDFGLAEEYRRWEQDNRTSLSDADVKFASLTGKYRSLSVEVLYPRSPNTDPTYLVHRFAYGWLETVLADNALDWTAARLNEDYGTPGSSVEPDPNDLKGGDTGANPEHYILCHFDGIDPAKADAVKAEVDGLTKDAFAPVINGETIGTGFYLLRSWVTREWQPNDSDRAATLHLLMAKPRFNIEFWEAWNTPSQTNQIALYNVPKYIVQSIIHTYNKQVGTSVQTGRLDEERGLLDLTISEPDPSVTETGYYVTENNCRFKVETKWYHKAATPIDVPANTQGITYDARWTLNYRTGFYEGALEKRTRLTTVVKRVVAADYEQTTTEYLYLGVYVQSGGAWEDNTGSTVTIDSDLADYPDQPTSNTAMPTNDTFEANQAFLVDQRYNDDCTQDFTFRRTTDYAAGDIEVEWESRGRKVTFKDRTTKKLSVLEADLLQLAAGQDNDVSINRLRTGGLNYRIVSTERLGSAQIHEIWQDAENLTEYEMETRYKPNSEYRYQYRFHKWGYNITYHSSESAAWEEIGTQGGVGEENATFRHVDPVRVDSNVWRAKKYLSHYTSKWEEDTGEAASYDPSLAVYGTGSPPPE